MERALLPLVLSAIAMILASCTTAPAQKQQLVVTPAQPLAIDNTETPAGISRVTFHLTNTGEHATLSLYDDDRLLIDSLDLPAPGSQSISALVHNSDPEMQALDLHARGAALRITDMDIAPIDQLDLPRFVDISAATGIDQVNSLKYGGPTVADLDQDGDYDFILNNHNDDHTKLYWNNADGTVSAHERNLSRWFMHDLHGTAAGDFDHDGDLDLVVTQGGGNGENPARANFYTNVEGTLVLTTGDVGIERGGRGRGARWSDMDGDGDLDLLLVNETGLRGESPQHFFYENTGDGRFAERRVAGIEDAHPSRVLVTDLDGDQIDDFILYGPPSVWRGNGDFTFTDISGQFPAMTAGLDDVMAITDIDIDNDGDLDLFLARGKPFEGGRGEAPWTDFDPLQQSFSIRPRGFAGTDTFTFAADGPVRLADYYFLTQGAFRGQDYPLFLGERKARHILGPGEEFVLEPGAATGWPANISENGVYFGYLGEGAWRAALVRNGDLFWGYQFTLHGVSDARPDFVPENRNVPDLLFRNDGGRFVDVSQEWGIPQSGNSLGVTTGDFNNDGHQDLLIYRWGYIDGRVADLMLLNNGRGGFEQLTMHGASDVGADGNGDMGQAFDYDLDGDLDLLSGSERGQWYLYENRDPGRGYHALVRVGYSPTDNIDSLGATVTLETDAGSQQRRVGSAGEIFSQSLLNIVHFGLGDQRRINRITVRWRNGETVSFIDQRANRMFDTDRLDPLAISISPADIRLRAGTKRDLDARIRPQNADQAIVWTSSNPEVVAVDESGTIRAIGEPGQTASITATTPSGKLASSAAVQIVDWFPVPVERLRIVAPQSELYVGETIALQAELLPAYADNGGIVWSSSDPAIARIDESGMAELLAPGQVTITAQIDGAPPAVDARDLDVEALTEPSITIVNRASIADGVTAGQDIEVVARYDAGSGNHVIASDEGGLRFWLRHFRSKWIPERDIIRVDPGAIGSRSGESSARFSLENLVPTAELPEGHFYQLRVTFTTSEGDMIEEAIMPLQINPPASPRP